jgi:preprotein translocase subunit SecA
MEELISKEEFVLSLKMTILQALDIHWMSHLDTMEHLRNSVGLRGYGQHDPLVEYKRESLALFRQMEKNIEISISNYLFYSLKEGIKNMKTGVQVQRVTEVKPVNSELSKIAENVKSTTEIGRNDPCYCGSGKKYKKCHGKDL